MARPDLPAPVASRAPATSSPPGPIRRHRTTVALLLALGLAASACGSSTADTAADQPTAPTTADGDDAPAESDDTAGAAEDATAGDGAEAADDGAGDDSEGTLDLANYPNVDVVDLGSGSTVNFAEAVAGGGLPTLIWFWAPH